MPLSSSILLSRILILALLVVSLSACTRGGEDARDVAVSNIRVGLMREGTDGSWRIYSQGNTFPLRPNGSCDVEGKTQECMWYGVEFDYTPAAAKLTLQCTATFNKPTDIFDPVEESVPKTDTTTFEIPLEGSNGHMAMPAAVFRQPDDTPAPWKADIKCGHGGRELLQYTFTALYEI